MAAGRARVAASILDADLSNLVNAVRRVEKAGADTVADFYRGKTITLVSGSSAGGVSQAPNALSRLRYHCFS